MNREFQVGDINLYLLIKRYCDIVESSYSDCSDVEFDNTENIKSNN